MLGECSNFIDLLLRYASDVLKVTDKDGVIKFVSPSVEKVKGYSPKELVGKLIFDFVHPEDLGLFKEAFKQCLSHPGEVINTEVRMLIKNNAYKFFDVTMHCPPEIENFGVVLDERDITQRKLFERRLEHFLYNDELTGLPNRKLFTEQLKILLAVAKKQRVRVGVVVIDVRDFKRIVELYGIGFGDKVLKLIGGRLLAFKRAIDLVGRLWGDEFALAFVLDSGLSGVHPLIEELDKALSAPMNIKGVEIRIKTNMGISFFPDDGEDPNELIQKAHLALSYARERNFLFHLFSQELEENIKKRFIVRSELINALENKEFILFYQPILKARGLEVVGAEALLRWRHPEKGLLSPVYFLEVAMDTGLIVDIGKLVISMVMGQLKEWFSYGLKLRVSFNVSLKEFIHEDFINFLISQVEEKGVRPEYVDIEITESAACDEPDRVKRIMELLKQYGFMLSLDDFGTGYSSLKALVDFPIDRIKVDKSFISNMLEDRKSYQVVYTSCLLGNSLSFITVAEGVETREQLSVLLEMGFDEVQGFYFSKPLSPKDFEFFVKRTKFA